MCLAKTVWKQRALVRFLLPEVEQDLLCEILTYNL
jgi:hypothetical protein